MMGKADTVEILYVNGSSRDRRGRRVVVCEGTVQNIIWPEDGVTDVDMRLLGVTLKDKGHIEQFFSQR